MRHPEPSDALISLEAACERLQVRPQIVYLAAHQKQLRTVKVGRRLKYLESEVIALRRAIDAGLFSTTKHGLVNPEFETAAGRAA